MPEEAPSWLREIDHTGDIGIEVRADSLDALFARAAWGMFSVLTDMDAVVPRASQEVTVEANDRDELMVRWLSDLNFLHVTQGWLFCTFEVRARSARRLVVLASGEHYNPERHRIYTEIKAVTFHGLKIRQQGAAWHVQIIFDM